jgi:hypothetical protein
MTVTVEGCSELLNEVSYHQGGQGPGAVRRTDCFHDIFENRRCPEKASRTAPCYPPVVRMSHGFAMKCRQILVQTQTCPQLTADLALLF